MSIMADLSLSEAITIVKTAGYRVTKPKTKAECPTLNTIGKPFGPNYDTNYRMRYRTSLAFLFKPMPASTPWVRT
jgi:hypothetical protein